MPTYQVELSHTISTTVSIDAVSPQAALATIAKADYPLPPRDEWQGHKDWRIVVRDENGKELLEDER